MRHRIALVIIAVVSTLTQNVLGQDDHFEDACDHSIYCQGELIHTIQLNHLYEDDKTFVDLALKFNESTVLQNFEDLNITGDVHNDPAKIEELYSFLNTSFENSTEFEDWQPGDWHNDPAFLENITDPEFKVWAESLHGFWEELGRKIKEDVRNNSDRYSMHYVSHPVIVPGGRFKEFYYWDSYWIQKGLLVSEMTGTVRGMVENFVEIVEKLGFIPNGGRIYYERSQPPLFLPMVKNYYDATKNQTFIRNNIQALEAEFQFFMVNRTISFSKNDKLYRMARYNVNRKGPRPESYSDDYELVEGLNWNQTEKDILYSNLKAGAESGWDYSSRWFVLEDNVTEGNLSHVKTRDIIPVDLNGFLYWNAVILNEFCQMDDVVCTQNASYYENTANQWKTNIYEVLWDEELGSWFDYDFVRGHLRKDFYATNVVPLWVNAHHNESAVEKIVKYFVDSGANNYPAGIPTSMLQTGEQWDFPNGWAPLNHMVVEAFENSGNQEAQELALDLAQRWTRTNHLAYLTHNKTMFEKYDVTCLGCAGGGGEYEVVVGFGWTNGVILDFLYKYGDKMTSLPCGDNCGATTTPPSTTTPNSGVQTQIGIITLLTVFTPLIQFIQL